MRGALVLLMIAAHASSAFLDDGYRAGWLWHQVNILFGFVAPAFLLLSGITLALSIGSDDRDVRRARSIRRALHLLFLGYWLQIPVLSIRQLIYNRRPDELARLFDVNILQAIGVSSLLLIMIAALTRPPKRAAWIAPGLALVVALATPAIWLSGLHEMLPAPVGRMFAPQPLSTFPLVPYVVHSLVGFGFAGWLFRSRAGRFAPAMTSAVGALLLIAGRVVPPMPPHDDLWGSSIHHTIYRLGGSLIFLGLGMWSAWMFERGTGWLEWIGRRSLGMYVLHLVMIYGSPVNAGLRMLIGSAQTPLVVMALIAVVTMACVAALLAWERLERSRPPLAAWTRRIGWGAFWLLFLTIP